MPGTTTAGNQVQFLLDGTNFFAQMLNEFNNMAAAAVNADTYVRLACWEGEHTLRLTAPGVAPARTLAGEITAVAGAGHDVKVILWEPSAIDRRLGGGMAQGVYNTNAAFRNHFAATANVDVYLEPYNGWFAGASNHQKIAIFSFAGQRRVLIGGLNFDDWYWDSPQHPGTFVGSGEDDTIHDTAVLIEGPATDAIEAEWTRRWNKSGRQLRANATAQTVYPNVGGQTVSVTVATTNSESWAGRTTDIQALLTQYIGNANNYIYMENYALADPTLVSAIARRIAQAPAPEVIVNVPGQMIQGGGYPYGFLMRNTFCKLTLPDCVNVQVPDRTAGPGASRLVNRAGNAVWRVNESANFWSTWRSVASTFANKWMASDRLEWKAADHFWIRTQSELLTAIQQVTGVGRMFTVVRATAGNTHDPVYIHSKLALIDDVAMIGSSNFTYRSQVYDGEIAVFIDNPTVVTNIRNALFNHFNAAGITWNNWRLTAATNAATFANNNAVVNQLYVLPVALGDFPTALPNARGNFTLY